MMMKIGAAQIDVEYGQLQKNLDRILTILKETKHQGVRLTVFPECSLCGYCCDTLDEARAIAISIDNPLILELTRACREIDIYAVVGFLELEDDQVFNSLVCVGPQGIVATYRKTHLPMLGVDRFTTPGSTDYKLFEIDGIKFGMLICYDCSFPEATRVLALLGADVVLLPTNWPSGALITSRIIPPARAMENHVYFVTADRVGCERGFDFVGRSRISHPSGSDLAFADHDHEEILIAEIDAKTARQKRLVRIPGKHEINLIEDRRPDLYGKLAQSGAM